MNLHFGSSILLLTNSILLLGGVVLAVISVMVLLKLNKALNIWLSKNSE